MHDACSRVVISPSFLTPSYPVGVYSSFQHAQHDPAGIRPVDPKASASCASITAKQLLGLVLCNGGMDPSSIVDLCRFFMPKKNPPPPVCWTDSQMGNGESPGGWIRGRMGGHSSVQARRCGDNHKAQKHPLAWGIR